MKHTIKKYHYLFGVILASISVMGCGGEGFNSASHMHSLELELAKNEKNVTDRENEIKFQKDLRTKLEENSKWLRKEIDDNDLRIKNTLAEMYADSRNCNTYPSKCRRCKAHFMMTSDKMRELFERRGTRFGKGHVGDMMGWGMSRFRMENGKLIPIKYFFDYCPACGSNTVIAESENKILKNTEEITQIDNKLVEAKLELNRSQADLQESHKKINNFKYLLTENDKKEHERVAANRRAADAERKLEEMTREKLGKQQKKGEKKINKFKQLWKGGMKDVSTLTVATGLSQFEVENLIREM